MVDSAMLTGLAGSAMLTDLVGPAIRTGQLCLWASYDLCGLWAGSDQCGHWVDTGPCQKKSQSQQVSMQAGQEAKGMLMLSHMIRGGRQEARSRAQGRKQ
jgi:hypothetical protein